jgi:peroxiredoxin
MALQVGDPAPLFQDPDILTGQTFKLSDHKGKCVLVAFHGITWCPPCSWAAPLLQELWDEEFSSNPAVQIVIISVNERPNPAALIEKGFTIPWLLDPAIPVAYQVGNSVPYYFFLDDELKIYKIQDGVFSTDHAAQKQAVHDAIMECASTHPQGPQKLGFSEVAIDPLALILSGEVYVLHTLPDPPPDGVLRRQVQARVGRMSKEQRSAARANLKQMQVYMDAIAKELK